LPLKKLYTFVSHFLKKVGPNKQARKKGKPQKYEDASIATLWLFQILRKALKRLKPQKGLPFIADKGYDAVDIIESLLDRGSEPAIRIKETMRMSIRHPLRKLSNENWKRYGKMRYRVEQLFGSIKQKIGSSFKLLREDLARKASIACTILWNFWVLATYLFLLFLSGILHYSYA